MLDFNCLRYKDINMALKVES